MSIGIPYAFSAPGGALICPVCARRIPESYDAEGERTTNNYGAHYEQEHAGVAGSSSDRRVSKVLLDAREEARVPSARDLRAAQGVEIAYDRYTVSLTVRVPTTSPLGGHDAAQLIVSALEVGLEGAGESIGPEDVELSFVDDAEPLG